MSVKQALRDTRYYIENYLWIKTKEGTLSKLVLNRPQKKVYKVLTSLKACGLPIRMICLKARQEGMSTLFGALLFEDTATSKYKNSLVAAHRERPSVTLFDMYKLFYKKLDARLCPQTTYSSRKELIFENPKPANKDDLGLQSKLTVYTAGAVDFSRGSFFHNIHWSEVAFTPDAESVHGVLLATVPKPPTFSQVFYESTANGPDGLFHDLFWDAWNNKNDWTPIFLPWYEMEEYSMVPPPNFVLDPEELKIMEKHGLSVNQLAWRRWVLMNDFRGDETKFMREYPATPEEAFTASLSCIFDAKALREMEAKVKEPIAEADVKDEGLVQRRNGRLKIWEWPAATGSYIMGIDAAGGKDSGDTLVCQVIRVQDGKAILVARYSDKIHPSQFAVYCSRIGKAYNEALAVPERNYHGVAVIGTLVDKDYFNIYRDRDGDYGIQVGFVNQYSLVDALAEAIFQRNLLVQDERTLRALKSYQQEGGKFFGPEDDFVDALRVAVYAIPDAMTVYRTRDEKKWANWDTREWTVEDWDKYFEANTGERGDLWSPGESGSFY